VETLYCYSRRKLLQPLLLYCLVLSFILPVYHTHGYPENLSLIKYNASEESLKPLEEGLSHSGKQGVSHLHLKKEFTRARSQFQTNKNILTVLSLVPNTSMAQFDNCTITFVTLEPIIFESTDATPFSGLSPPSL
jgi:hypothetical protein